MGEAMADCVLDRLHIVRDCIGHLAAGTHDSFGVWAGPLCLLVGIIVDGAPVDGHGLPFATCRLQWWKRPICIPNSCPRERVFYYTCLNEYHILYLSVQDDTIWVAPTDSSFYGWPTKGRIPQNGGSFLVGKFSFSRAKGSLEGSAHVCELEQVTKYH